jgi:hypothetical protein
MGMMGRIFGDGGLNGFSGFMALNVYSIYHFATT